MELKIIFWILVCHLIADFFLQTDWQAKNKSSDWSALTYHVLVYSTTVSVLAFPFITEAWQFFALYTITVLCHFTTDAITSRIVKGYFAKEDHHNGFIVIGIDQVLHYAQLILTYNFILQ